MPFSPDGGLDPRRAVFLLLCLTRRCNMRCPDCFYLQTDAEFFQNRDMPFERATAIIDFYAAAGLRQIIPEAEGEWLLYPRARDILTHMRERKQLVRPWMVSNGLRLGEYADFLLDHTGAILVSLDAADASAFAAFRGAAEKQFDVVIDSLRALVAAKRARGSGPEIIVNCVSTADRVAEIPTMIAFAEELGVDSIKFSNFHVTGASKRRPLRFEIPGVPEMLNQVVRRTDYPIGIFLPHVFGAGRIGKHMLGQTRPPFLCRMLASVAIGANGDFAPCCRMPTAPEWGNFFTAPEKHNAEPLRAFRLAFQSARTHAELPAICHECSHLSPRRLAFDPKRRAWGVAHVS